MIYLELFWCFVRIGLVSFGGGYAAMALIQSEVVAAHGWLTMEMFSDLVTLSEMTPGPIAINAATFVGMRVANVPGALVATLGYVLPACCASALMAWLFTRYSRIDAVSGALGGIGGAVIALVFFSALTLTRAAATDAAAIIVMVAGFFALRTGWLKPMGLLGLAALIGLGAYGITLL